MALNLTFDAMKKNLPIKFLTLFSTCFILLITACKKESFITGKDAYIRLSEDTLHFDTVFTELGSTTQFLKIFNVNDQKLKLSSVELMGGASSFFKLNVDGVAGTRFTNIELEANDSLYLFATVKIDPNIANLPFLVRDSVKIEFNGNIKWLQLEAYGKNARFMRGYTVTKDSTLHSDLPIVILDSLTVMEGVTLTIEKGANLFIHPNAPISIKGSLQATGDTSNKIVFQGIRIDEPYKNYPGGWPGIYFAPSSKNNLLKYCVLKNAYQGVALENPSTNINSKKLVLEQCILDNIYDKAIVCSNSSFSATNCLISNVGFGLYIVSGGNYTINHCTFVSLGTSFISHKESLITLSNTNADKTNSNPLKLTIDNSIIYGEGGFVDDEIDVPINTSDVFSAKMNNVVYKQKTVFNDFIISKSYDNINPQFDSIDISKRYFNFRLKNGSPCIDSAKISSPLVQIDLDGHPRSDGLPDIGCYEKQ